MNRLTAGSSVLTGVAVSALLVGCSASLDAENSEPKMSADKVSSLVSQKLASTTGKPKPDISCPEDLVGKVGTTMKCKLTASDGSTLGVTITVTSVDGDQINFDFEADATASPAS
jgi:hypothetical protein